MPTTTTTSTLSRATVCTRCLVRLTRSPARSIVSTRHPSLSRGGSRSRPSSTTTATVKDDDGDDGSEDVFVVRPGLPPTVLRSNQGRKLQGEIAQLDSRSLGKPLDVVLLRDVRFNAKREKTNTRGGAVVPDPRAEKASLQLVEDLAESLNAERGPVDMKTVKKNLDGLRPPPSRQVMSRENYELLTISLRNGFTTAQLACYVKDWMVAQRTGDHIKTFAVAPPPQSRSDPSSAVVLVPWKAGVTPFAAGHMLSTKAELGGRQRRSPKDRLVLRLLRDCWGIRTLEDDEQVGQLQLILPSVELSLLLDDKRDILRSASGRHHVMIDVSRARGVILVTAKEESANAVATIIQATLAQRQRLSIDLRPLRAVLGHDEGGQFFTAPTILDNVGRMTGVAIEVQDSGDTLAMCSLGPDMTSLEDARRLLLAALRPPFDSQVRVLAEWDDLIAEAALYPVSATERLPWVHQSTSWARLRMAFAKSDDAVSELEESSAHHDSLPGRRSFKVPWTHDLVRIDELKSLSERLPARRLVAPAVVLKSADHASSVNPPPGPRWGTMTRTSTVALVGQVLHQANQFSIPWFGQAKRLLRASPKNRTFSYEVPNLVRTISSTFDRTDRPKQESIRISLRPSPWSSFGGAGCKVFPALEVTVGVDSVARHNRIVKVQAIIKQRSEDILLPRKKADLRLCHRVHLDLLHPGEFVPITDFIGSSRLNVWSNERLQTPSSIRLPIPRWLLSSAFIQEHVKDNLDEVEMEYLFAGLEFRQTLHLTGHGCHARFSAIEGGMTGGRRTELEFVVPEMETSTVDEMAGVNDQSNDQPLEQSSSENYRPGEEVEESTPVQQQLYEAAYRFIDQLDQTNFDHLESTYSSPPPVKVERGDDNANKSTESNGQESSSAI